MGTPKHKNRKHALLSASGASRWIGCAPSARLEEGYKIKHGDKSSIYAQEGTLAHEFADVMLNGYFHSIEVEDKLKRLREHTLYTKEMEPQVAKYVDYVIERYRILESAYGEILPSVEERLDFSEYVPEGFGTGDMLLVSANTLEVIDLKYGMGVAVSAKDNAQLMLYGLGALESYGLLYDIQQITLTVHQPRLNSVSSHTLSVKDLLTWADLTVKPSAKLAYDGKGEKNAGSWCRFCKVKNTCRAYNAMNLELAKYEFLAADQLNNEELVEVFKQAETIARWVKELKEYMLEQANKGSVFPGYKLVRGKGKRRWLNPEAALAILLADGHQEEDVTNTKLKGIGEISNLYSVDNFAKFKAHILRPEGKPELAPENDPRAAIGVAAAKEAFKD